MAEGTTKLALPRVKSATLRNFSLYSRKKEIKLQFPDGVFCLAGANGLGKSTFLLAINFAITGRVPEPARDFKSVEEYYKHTYEFSSTFFDGRINDDDRESAEIHLTLKAGDFEFQICRGMFEPDDLREFKIKANGQKWEDVEAETPGELHLHYAEELTKAVGVASFEQIVFLQYFVLTFDERRHLLFWNHKELDQTLYLAFGVDRGKAQHADSLRRKIERLESRARNANWQATTVRDKLKDLESRVTPRQEKVADLVDEHKELQRTCQELSKTAQSTSDQLRDANLRLADLSVKQTMLRGQYDEEFAKRLRGTSNYQRHPLIRSSLAEEHCHLCDSSGAEIKSAIQHVLDAHRCPLCGTAQPNGRRVGGIEELKKIDEKLSETGNELKQALMRRHRLEEKLVASSRELDVASKELDAFTDENQKALARLQGMSSKDISAILSEYRQQLEHFLSEKSENYVERDKIRKELRGLQKELQSQYAAAETEFVPAFQTLAKSFLGVDLDIRIETSPSKGLALVLGVRGTDRREHYQLSESQRFFIDIALRMALVQFVSRDDCPACLYIDTPEGSLDIAYETKAGRMIAQFVESGFSVIMTANINSSRLLLSLAEECGREKMRIQQMTNWAELSDVQVEEEELFKEAYREIESALG
jgi:DNA repair exonuclease SbcCD ATPase subunit